MALLDSFALSNALSSVDSLSAAFTEYTRQRRLHVRLYQAASIALTPFYQSDNRILPWLRDAMFEPVSKLPFSDKVITNLGAGMLGAGKLLNRGD